MSTVIAGKKKTVAVYDFDGTITDRHTFWRFLRALVGPYKFWFTVVTMIPWIIGIYYRGASIMAAREVLIRRLLKGLTEQHFKQTAEAFAKEQIPAWVKEQALASINAHRSQGSELLLISNSAKSYLEPWSRSVGIATVFGSEFEVDSNGRLTGNLHGTHCQGKEKLVCLQRHLGSLQDYELHVYGDSEGDIDMLNAADFAYYLTFDDLHRNDQRLCVQ
ncbi:HAD-IB family hydrolase [Andreprevotia chitinilytica]|uniref:HAD-IB family hydrolase n=1 Tax=Andreprevotia chitinilytica TaxID=396808 RepID=UPI0005537CCC|nr:HAD-IB family hydrolase [Andreprevotia chitinilytica]